MDQTAKLTEKEMGHPGCGSGTPNACYALSLGPGGFQCLNIANPEIAGMAGIKLGWRVNVDTDGKVWCPKGILNNSKIPPGLED